MTRLCLSGITLERSQAKVERLIAELTVRPMTPPEICEFMRLEKGQMARYLRIMKAENLIHITRWTRDAVAGLVSRPRPVWAAGEGIDARKIKLITHNQSNKRQAKVRKLDPERYEKYLLEARRRAHKRNFKPRMDIAASWIVARPAPELEAA